MGIKRYRRIDLAIFFLLFATLEVAALLTLKDAFSFFVLSLVLPVTLIAYMRWNFYGLIYPIFGGIIYALIACFPDYAANDVVKSCITYAVGNACSVAAMLFFIKDKKGRGKERLEKNIGLIFLYALSAFAAVIIARSVIGAIFGDSFFTLLGMNAGAEALNYVFTVLILIIADRQKGFFTDQKDYYSTNTARR